MNKRNEIEKYLKDNLISKKGMITSYKTKKASIIASLIGWNLTAYKDEVFQRGKSLFSFYE